MAEIRIIYALQCYYLNKFQILKIYFYSSFKNPKISAITVSLALASQVCTSLMLFWFTESEKYNIRRVASCIIMLIQSFMDINQVFWNF